MALRVSVKSNIDEVIGDLGLRTPAVVKRATASGLNKGIRASQTKAVRLSARETGIAQKWIRQKMKRKLATRNKLWAQVTFDPRGLNPRTIGMSLAKAVTYYRGPHVGQPFTMLFPNGTLAYVVRLPSSVAGDGKKERDSRGRLRKGRLPVKAIRVPIGKTTIEIFEKELATTGIQTFTEEYRRIVLLNWGSE